MKTRLLHLFLASLLLGPGLWWRGVSDRATSGADHALTGASEVSAQAEMPNEPAAAPTDSGQQLPDMGAAAGATDGPAPDAAALTAGFLSSISGRASQVSTFIPDNGVLDLI